MSLDANKGGDIPKIAIILKTERGMHDATWPPAHALHYTKMDVTNLGLPATGKYIEHPRISARINDGHQIMTIWGK